MIEQKRNHNAYRLPHPFAAVRTFTAGYVGGIVRANRHIDQLRPARTTGLRAAPLSRRWLSLDTRILGLCRRRLLLGAGYVGDGSGRLFPVDSSLLGLERQRICLLRWLLG